jgi:hypothetical protein
MTDVDIEVGDNNCLFHMLYLEFTIKKNVCKHFYRIEEDTITIYEENLFSYVSDQNSSTHFVCNIRLKQSTKVENNTVFQIKIKHL